MKHLYFVALLLGLSACGPRNYDQCVLENVSDQMSEMALRVTLQACRNEFPLEEKTTTQSEALPPQALSLLTGRAEIMYENKFGGNLYNGSDFTITQVEIGIESIEDDSSSYRVYVADAYIKPKSTGSFSFDVLSCNKPFVASDDSGGNFPSLVGSCDWSVVGAKGMR